MSFPAWPRWERTKRSSGMKRVYDGRSVSILFACYGIVVEQKSMGLLITGMASFSGEPETEVITIDL